MQARVSIVVRMSTPRQGPAPRTLADQLRGWPDGELAALLRARPDLATPTPQDTSQLASRAGTRASVLRAVDQLTLLELTVLDAVLALGGTAATSTLRTVVNADPAAVDAALTKVRGLALVWGADDALRALSVLTDVVGTKISRLGQPLAVLMAPYGPSRVTTLTRDLGLTPSGNRHDDVDAVAAHLSDPTEVAKLVAEVDDQARAILEHLADEGKDGSVESTERTLSRGGGGSPVDQLLARGLLVARDRAARRGAPRGRRSACATAGPPAPGPTSSPRSPPRSGTPPWWTGPRPAPPSSWSGTSSCCSSTGARRRPPPCGPGGLGVRDLKATAELLHTDERTAALHVEIALAADLVATGTTGTGDAVWLPTETFDIWSAASVADRWTRLALAWLDCPRLVGLVGGREAGKPVNALVPDLERMWLPETRRAALEQVAALEPGTVLAAGTGVPSLVERMAWLRPRRPSVRAQAVAWVTEEAAVVGVTALGGMSVHGRALLSPDDPQHHAPAALGRCCPSRSTTCCSRPT